MQTVSLAKWLNVRLRTKWFWVRVWVSTCFRLQKKKQRLSLRRKGGRGKTLKATFDNFKKNLRVCNLAHSCNCKL